jgi:hypothetical protein
MEEADTAQDCIVVMTNAEGEIIWLCTSDKLSTKIGLLETAKICVAEKIRRLDSE